MSAPDLTHLSDPYAEARAVGALMGLPVKRTEDLRRLLVTQDFHSPMHAAMWAATVEAIADGTKGASTIVSELIKAGKGGICGDQGDSVARLQETVAQLAIDGGQLNDAEVSSAVARVADAAGARRAWQVGIDLHGKLSRREDLGDVAAYVIDHMRDLGVSGRLPEGYGYADDYLDEDVDPDDVVVPGLFNREWRVVTVGLEGSGKSWLARQVIELAAQGLHPFRQATFTPIRTLTVDLENPRESVRSTQQRIKPLLQRQRHYDRSRSRYWRQPQGIDIRSSRGYSELVTVLRDAKPDLVYIGPAYHMARQSPRESDEMYATSVLDIISDLRTRFRFAVMIEHHAPHGDSAHREIRPFGSSAWLRWPEIGIAMKPAGPDDRPFDAMEFGRWRRDRVVNQWPAKIVRVSRGMRPWWDAGVKPNPDEEARR